MFAQEKGPDPAGDPTLQPSSYPAVDDSRTDRPKPPNHRDRVLGMLLEADEVCGSEMYAAFLPRFSVQIHRLRRAGYVISKRSCDIEAHHHDGTGWLYRLEALPAPPVETAVGPGGDPSQASLLES